MTFGVSNLLLLFSSYIEVPLVLFSFVFSSDLFSMNYLVDFPGSKIDL